MYKIGKLPLGRDNGAKGDWKQTLQCEGSTGANSELALLLALHVRGGSVCIFKVRMRPESARGQSAKQKYGQDTTDRTKETGQR